MRGANLTIWVTVPLLISTLLICSPARGEYIAAWGDNLTGQCDKPSGGDFTDLVALYDRSVALKSDGTIVN